MRSTIFKVDKGGFTISRHGKGGGVILLKCTYFSTVLLRTIYFPLKNCTRIDIIVRFI